MTGERNKKQRIFRTKTISMMIYLNQIISLIISGFNAPIKKERLSDWVKKHDNAYSVY